MQVYQQLLPLYLWLCSSLSVVVVVVIGPSMSIPWVLPVLLCCRLHHTARCLHLP